MTIHLGNVDASSTLYIPFATYAGSTGASATLTGLAVTDIEIYKNGSVTQRASDAGYALLDTDGIDFDGITGIHGFSVDLADNTDAGFYSAGGFYWVVVSAVTVDSQTVNFIAATFRIGPAAANVTQWLGTAASTPTVAGVPNVNVKTWNDLTTVALPLVPTTAGRTLDVSAGGEAGVDWANVGSPTTAVNLSATNIDVDQIIASVSGAVGSVTGAVGSVTGLTASNLDVAVSTLATQASVNTIDDFLDTEIADIRARLPAALTAGGNMKSDLLAISGSITAADNLEGGGLGLVVSTCAAGSTTTSVVTNLTEATDDHYNGRVITFTSGALLGQTTSISDYNGTTKTLTVVALTESPADTTGFVIS